MVKQSASNLETPLPLPSYEVAGSHFVELAFMARKGRSSVASDNALIASSLLMADPISVPAFFVQKKESKSNIKKAQGKCSECANARH